MSIKIGTVLVELGQLRPFSDIAGRYVHTNQQYHHQVRQELALRLQAADCPVNLDGTEWHAAVGTLTPPSFPLFKNHQNQLPHWSSNRHRMSLLIFPE